MNENKLKLRENYRLIARTIDLALIFIMLMSGGIHSLKTDLYTLSDIEGRTQILCDYLYNTNLSDENFNEYVYRGRDNGKLYNVLQYKSQVCKEVISIYAGENDYIYPTRNLVYYVKATIFGVVLTIVGLIYCSLKLSHLLNSRVKLLQYLRF